MFSECLQKWQFRSGINLAGNDGTGYRLVSAPGKTCRFLLGWSVLHTCPPCILDQPSINDVYRLINGASLFDAWCDLNKKAAAGVDRITARRYEQNLTENIRSLMDKLKEKPSKTAFITAWLYAWACKNF